MPDKRPPVHELGSVSFAGTTAVELAGNLTAPAPLGTPLGGNSLAFRTDVGFTVMERARDDSNNRVAVFHLEKTEMAAAAGLALDVDGTRIQLDPAQLQLKSLPATAIPCQTPPTGCESVMSSRHAVRGRLTRRDQRLMAGDRVELAGSIEPAPGGGFRSTGAYVLHDLSTGALTQRDQRKRFVRGIIGIVALAFGLVGLMLSVVLSLR